MNLNEAFALDGVAKLTRSFGADYRGSTVAKIHLINPAVMSISTIGGYSMIHGNIVYTHGP